MKKGLPTGKPFSCYFMIDTIQQRLTLWQVMMMYVCIKFHGCKDRRRIFATKKMIRVIIF